MSFNFSFYSALFIVIALILIPIIGVASHLQILFGIVIPYLAFIIFLAGMIYQVVKWAKCPVPFRIPTTCGQEKSLPWIKYSRLESPFTTFDVIGRMVLEVLFFRSLFRNTKTVIHGERLSFVSAKWLWLGAIAFHYSFLVVLIRHLRFFTEPTPFFVRLIEKIDGFFQITIPALYLSGIVLVAALLFLLARRVVDPKLRYISLPADYFPLFLIISIALSGILMRYIFKTNIVAVKELTMGLATFHPRLPEGISAIFYVHIFLVSVLFAYFPFSKLTHMAGVFLSPTRNLANNNRAVRHINPWNPPVVIHTYEEWEEEFKDKIKAAGIPLDKEE
ncbi:MAG TPA: menaquinol oxidoreductase [Candidatus Desulfofervidus auxilii]|uniref:Menaquinol oxidoreductase n=1 Tax=Desulfofervidus auxilii TaxID=1621989 RepID=A0A7C1VMX0_DESA2|nr:sulfate reduction electron transfer complex DsrMKJOP subunit DsrM [Candidatus Desulfofervidus auxilii]HEC67442.1 menaquinol oxidoreductase [Candidatus Desulfofervidus auxilii]